MYLKQIEIHGFKSFANDTILTFEKGITAIVGPNGSGKSNIADAVRWVLGERSMKQLRGAETLDVIFAGTELRKAQGFAYVNLIIDNSDKKIPISYDEIQVSRRLYRSGESEYKLNGADCRLKDIIELFYDTGIGKEGYSIIGQGQISKILSNKPEDRRELFDEAVGIVKYKKRKIIAEKKLEEERLNLSRVQDIINEIERQIEPLKKQADAAKEYLNLKDELILYESNNFVREVDEETKNIKKLESDIETNKNNLKKLKEEKIAFNNKYNEIDDKITKLDLEITDIKDNITEKKALLENIKGQINVLKEQINSEMSTSSTRTDRIESFDKSIAEIKKDIFNQVNTLIILKKQIELININNHETEESVNQFSKDFDFINNALENVKNVVEKNKIDIDLNIKVDDSAIYNSNFNFNKNIANQESLQKITKDIDEANNRQIKLNNDLTKYHDELTIANEELLKAQNNYLESKTKHDALKSMIEKNDGYQNAVKNVLDNKEKFSGIIGTVADIISTDKKYELAIEIALGNTIQNIVTENVEVSKSVINYLKTNNLGRVTTLPLSAISFKENKIYDELISESGVIGLAVTLVKYNNKYNNLANYLLKNCVVIDNYDNAKVLFQKYKSSIKIVTLQGELFNPGGAISGGSHKNSTTVIGRKREYEELRDALPILQNKINDYINKKDVASKNYDDTFEAIEKLKDDINKLNIDKNTIKLNIINDMKLEYSNISNKVRYTIDILDKNLLDIDNIVSEKNKLLSGDKDIDISIKDKNDKIAALDSDIKKTESEINDLQNTIDEKNKEKTDSLSNRKEYYEAKDRLATEQITLEQESSKLSNQLEKSNLKIADITNSMLENYNLTYANALEKYKEDLGTSEEIKNYVKEKRKLIQELGPINVNAIEEYDQIGDRYRVMTTQYEDIKKSEEMISDIVGELDRSMKDQFNTNFEHIKTEFQRVFKILFGGGKADLLLVEVEDKGELDAGVVISVQPPGKKLGNMMQLSGGEQALTAIALLFAIQNLKPSPFCLLDEIEAALDESNVDRFADYLKNLTNETQFILITHRRGTMEKADRLYGITMQEKGITALVSVDLIEDQLT